jgi:hypothetical protein
MKIDNNVINDLTSKYTNVTIYLHSIGLYDFIMAFPGYRVFQVIQKGIELRGEESLNVVDENSILLRASVVTMLNGEIHDEGKKMLTTISKAGFVDKIISLLPLFDSEIFPKKTEKDIYLVFHMQVLAMLEYFKRLQLGTLKDYEVELAAFVLMEESTHKIDDINKETTHKVENTTATSKKEETKKESAKQWYLYSNNKEIGPYNTDEIWQMIINKQVDQLSLFRKEGIEKSERACRIAEINELLIYFKKGYSPPFKEEIKNATSKKGETKKESANQWYFYSNNKEIGPYNTDEIWQMIINKQVDKLSLARKEGSEKCEAVRNFAEINELLNYFEEVYSPPIKEVKEKEKSKKHFRLIYDIVGGLILVIAFLTNPNNLQKHKDALIEKYNEQYVGVSNNNSDIQNAVNSLKNLENLSLTEIIEPFVYYKNYYLFSLTKFADKTVGFGIFGKVFIFSDAFKSMLEKPNTDNINSGNTVSPQNNENPQPNIIENVNNQPITINNKNSTTNNDLQFLIKDIGKSKEEADLLNNPIFIYRLKNLLGDDFKTLQNIYDNYDPQLWFISRALKSTPNEILINFNDRDNPNEVKIEIVYDYLKDFLNVKSQIKEVHKCYLENGKQSKFFKTFNYHSTAN